ncbi:hypothetical protein [Demequina sp. NBRC 110052]|uniref:hypothetical protein n=1 Tax=Demequina sp. NBRC 110052 TaxID=1570341 RepID=UPI000A04023D|nr:hypothetical protein [Demequina sp. NBRC 110052]
MTAGQPEVAATAELDTLRWWLLRWGPRADSGVILAGEPDADGNGRVDAATLAVALPVLAMTRDFAPADMQYRMHRELLWDESSQAWAASAPVDARGVAASAHRPASAAATRVVIDALRTALAIGGDAVPEEMRGRWARQLDELVEARVSAG